MCDRIRRSQLRLAFTLIELLVVMAIIGMLIVALMPAVQAARASARQTECKGNMVQLVMALQNFEMAHTHFPAGVKNENGPIQATPNGLHQSWVIGLLPYLDEGTLHGNIDQTKSVYGPENQSARAITVPLLLCPSEASTGPPRSSYAGVHHDLEAAIDDDNHGVLFLNSQTTIEDIRDGLSQTLIIGEKRSYADDLGWMSGTRATLRNTGTPINVNRWKPALAATKTSAVELEDFDESENADSAGDDDDSADPQEDATEKDMASEEASGNQTSSLVGMPPLGVGGFGSGHGGGAHMAFADGRVQFMPATTSPQVLQQLGHRDDGKLLDPLEYRE